MAAHHARRRLMMPAAVTLYPLIVLFSVIWESAFVVGEPALVELDPYTFMALCFCLRPSCCC
ncbi:hypothetical protein BI364_16820 [Acidihalobacter yilgarnensis]|uniref:Uncharacterized protein n=2 Tax=Acidihalobacter yilgarnensis TaxID=2819280 RepID=A0A1D8IS53_9GAMM|nr:hypothetical protein BI364_16820 [Acidihalobacter yilgarnensis]